MKYVQDKSVLQDSKMAGASYREVNEDMRLWYVLVDAVPFFTGCVIVVVQFSTKTSKVTSLFNRESLTSSSRESHTTNCPLITTTRTGSSNADLLKAQVLYTGQHSTSTHISTNRILPKTKDSTV